MNRLEKEKEMAEGSVPGPNALMSVDYEVFGKVQGVFFRKYTRTFAIDMDLKGWVMNTAQGTVIGQIQGKKKDVDAMKDWLQNVGSPKSKIEKVVFRNERTIANYAFKSFGIRR